MKILKRIKRIYVFLIILVILIFSSLFIISCNNNETVDNAKTINTDEYSIEKAMGVNTLDNLTKETGYYSFSMAPMEKVINSFKAYAHDNFLIFDLEDSDITIVTDKSSAYIIEDNEVKKHRKLNNYDQNSFLIDKSLHDTNLNYSYTDNKIFHKFLSSSKNCKEKLKYLNDSFPEIFHFDENKYEGLFTSYYFYDDTYELFGYNVIGSLPDTELGTTIMYMFGRTKKDISDEEKNKINNLIRLVKNYKE